MSATGPIEAKFSSFQVGPRNERGIYKQSNVSSELFPWVPFGTVASSKCYPFSLSLRLRMIERMDCVRWASLSNWQWRDSRS